MFNIYLVWFDQVEECRETTCSKLGYTRTCTTKYYTECSTDVQYNEMEEDHPVCNIEKQVIHN